MATGKNVGRKYPGDDGEHYDILVNAKWRRISITLPYIMTLHEADRLNDALAASFRTTADAVGE